MLAAGLRALERVANNPFNAKAGVLADFRSDLMWRAFTQGAAVSAVQSLGPFTNNDEVDLSRVGQGAGRGGVQLRGAEVHVVVESKAHLEQKSTFQNPGRHCPRSADGAKQNGIMFA